MSGKRLTSGPQPVFPALVSNSAVDPEQSSSDTALGPAGGQEGSIGGVGGARWWWYTAPPVQSWNVPPPQLQQARKERLLPRNMQGGDGSNIQADQGNTVIDLSAPYAKRRRIGMLLVIIDFYLFAFT